MTSRRFFAVVPAAGRSRRMGRAKLLLPWRGRAILDHVLDAWQRSRASAVVVVCRQEDLAVRELCRRHCVDTVCPAAAPADMKESLQHALRYLSQRYEPQSTDCWLTAPADLPTLSSLLIDRVIGAADGRSSIVVPRFGTRRGHPVLFPWPLSSQVFTLRHNQGIDQIVAREEVLELDLPSAAAIEDIDTPEDYERLRSTS